MCDEPRPTTESLARLTPHIVDDLEVEPIALEPVDAVHLTTLVDNLSDLTLLDQGPAKRANVISAAHMPRLPAPLFEQGEIGPDLFRAACNMGLEGMVSKRADRPYRAGRSKDWVKVENRNHPAMDRVMDSFLRPARPQRARHPPQPRAIACKGPDLLTSLRA